VFDNDDLVLLNLAESTVVTLKTFDWPVSNLTGEEDGRYSFLLEWSKAYRNMLLCFMEYP
jgi:hypothetical protein